MIFGDDHSNQAELNTEVKRGPNGFARYTVLDELIVPDAQVTIFLASVPKVFDFEPFNDATKRDRHRLPCRT